MNGLAGKRALVTGGSRGIGAAAAELFAEYGTHVAIGYRSRQADADALCARLRASGVRAHAFASDISTQAGAQQLVDRAADALGGIDFFVGSAGIWPCGLRRRCASCRFSPPRRSTVCFRMSMPFSAMNMRTMRGLGPIES